MTPYGKTAQHAIAAMSRLAEVYAEQRRLNSADIAQSRDLPKPVVAKVLTVLSQAGLVVGSPGPGGGYALARPPEQIRLIDISQLFDRQEDALSCPFGPRHCGTGSPCPLHHQLEAIRERLAAFLTSNTLAVFAAGEKPGPLSLPLISGS